MREPATHAVVTHVLDVSRKIQPSVPNVVELLLRTSRSVTSSNARPANVVTNPSPCRPLANSFCARYTPYAASGSISWPQRAPRLSCSVARSRRVIAVRPPTFQLPATLPVSLSAPRMCAPSGPSTYPLSGAPGSDSERPMRRLYRKFGPDQLNPQKLLWPPYPNSKIDEPSTKNGRLSLKKVSRSLRFTTAGSTSTWPKSGLTVALSVRFEPSPIRASAPNPGSTFEPSLNGSAAGRRVNAARLVAYGMISRRRGGSMRDRKS